MCVYVCLCMCVCVVCACEYVYACFYMCVVFMLSVSMHVCVSLCVCTCHGVHMEVGGQLLGIIWLFSFYHMCSGDQVQFLDFQHTQVFTITASCMVPLPAELFLQYFLYCLRISYIHILFDKIHPIFPFLSPPDFLSNFVCHRVSKHSLSLFSTVDVTSCLKLLLSLIIVTDCNLKLQAE